MFDLPNGDNALSILSANGADPNAFTSSGVTCYYFQCTEGFEENLRMLLHFVSTPYFTDETVAKEQGIIAQEIRMGEDNPGMVVYYNLLGLLYDHHPIRDRVAGTVESISHITAQTLYDCHRVFYAPSNMVLCVEGCVDPETVARIAEEELPKERAEIPTADFGEKESMLPRERLCRVQGEVSAPQFLIGAKLDCAGHGEAALRQHLVAALCLRMLCGSSSTFYTRLYADGLLSVDFDYETDFSAGTGTVIIGGESREPEKILEEFSREVERIAAEGFDTGSFERAKRASSARDCAGLRISTMSASRWRWGFSTATARLTRSACSNRSRRRCRRLPWKTSAARHWRCPLSSPRALLQEQKKQNKKVKSYAALVQTIQRDSAITFPMFGNLTINPPSYFTVFGMDIYFYGVIIGLGFILGILYCLAQQPPLRHRSGQRIRRDDLAHPDGDHRRAALLRALPAGLLASSTRTRYSPSTTAGSPFTAASSPGCW